MSAPRLLEHRDSDAVAAMASPRTLIVTWQHPQDRSIRAIGFLAFDGERYEFRYIRNALSVTDFRPLLGFPELDRRYESPSLFPLFAQRAMDPRRPDFSRYITRLGLEADSTPWEQIARSGGRRVGDTLQLFPVPTVSAGTMSCAFLVHGIRHMGEHPLRLADGDSFVTQEEVQRALNALEPGSPLGLVPEGGNPVNSNALLVAADGTPIGYVPDLLVDDLAVLRTQAVLRAEVLRVNGPDAPSHLRVLARLSADNIGAFQFFTDSCWQPIGQ